MSAQTTYSDTVAIGFSGAPVGRGVHNIVAPKFNGEASASIPHGFAVKKGASDDKAVLPTTETDQIIGLVQMVPDSFGTNGNLDIVGVKAGALMSVAYRGRMFVKVETSVVAGDGLWVRCTTAGAELAGQSRNSDTGTATIDCTKQGKWMTSASAGGIAELEFDFTRLA